MKVNSIVKNSSLYLFGNIFNKAIAFVTVPIFTRLLSAEEYGIVNTYASWVNLMSVIVGLSLGNSIRNAFVDMRDELGEYISSIFMLACVNFGVICTIILFVGNHISLSRNLIWFCLVESFFNFVINALVARYVMEEEAVKRTALLVLPNLTGAILSVILIMLLQDNRQYGRIIGTCVSTTIFGLSILIYYMVKYRTFFSKRFWGYALPISVPMVFHGLSCNVLGTSDRTIITYYCGAAETGIYSLIYNLSMVTNVVTSSAESVFVPRMTRYLQENDYYHLNKEIKIYIYVVLFFFCGLLTIAPELVLFLGGEEYVVGDSMIFPIVMASFVTFLYGVYVGIEAFYKKNTVIAIATLLAAGINILLNIVFVPFYGRTAAAYTTLVSYIISFLIHSVHTHRINSFVAPYRSLILPIFVILCAGIITTLLREFVVVRIILMCMLGTLYVIIIRKRLFKEKL